jgi:hypothetical protein
MQRHQADSIAQSRRNFSRKLPENLARNDKPEHVRKIIADCITYEMLQPLARMPLNIGLKDQKVATAT